MLRDFLAAALSLLVPPRHSERLVSSLALADLLQLEANGVLPYHDPRVTALVWEIKYYANARAADLAGAYLADTLLAIAAEELGPPLLVPVPIHARRRQERGHNQTEALCKAALSHVGEALKYAPHALSRTEERGQQQGLERKRRLKNVHGSMAVPDGSVVAGRVCIVLDDVSTTGATLEEAARALRAGGALRVHTVALAYA